MAALGGADYLKAFAPQQLHDLAYVLLKVHSLGYGASLLFFGFCCVVFGYLIHQSGYLPRILGALLVIAGVGYVVFSLAQMLAPAFAAKFLFPWAISLKAIGVFGFWSMVVFLGVLTVGFIYEWKKGALEWE